MLARRIPRSYRNLTGRVSMLGQEDSTPFESPLERDFYLLLDFNPLVVRVDAQPVRIEVQLANGLKSRYIPDALVHYTPESGMKPVLCEIKPYDELVSRWEEFRPRFKAAVRQCLAEGWVFHIYTEREIRTPFLDNVRFLRGHDRSPVDDLKRSRVRRYVGGNDLSTIGAVLNALCPVISERGPWLSTLWHLIAIGELDADLSVPLGYATPLSLPTPASAHDE